MSSNGKTPGRVLPCASIDDSERTTTHSHLAAGIRRALHARGDHGASFRVTSATLTGSGSVVGAALDVEQLSSSAQSLEDDTFGSEFQPSDVAILRRVRDLVLEARDDGGLDPNQPNGKLLLLMLEVVGLSLIPAVATAAGGILGMRLKASSEASLIAEQIAGGALFLSYARELFDKPSRILADTETVRRLEQLLRGIRRTKADNGTLVLARSERDTLLAVTRDDLYRRDQGLRMQMLLTSIIGVIAAVVTLGLLEGSLFSTHHPKTEQLADCQQVHNLPSSLNHSWVLEWRNYTAEQEAAAMASEPSRERIAQVLPFAIGFATDGLATAYESREGAKFTIRTLIIPLLLAVDSFIDAFGIAPLLNDIEGVRNARELVFILFGVGTVVTAFVTFTLRLCFGRGGSQSATVHAFLQAFAAASIATGSLESMSAGFNAYALLGFVISWALGYVADALEN